MKAKKFIVLALASASVISAIGIAYAQSTAPSAPAGSNATTTMPSNTPSTDSKRAGTAGMNNQNRSANDDTVESKSRADRG